MTSKTPRLEHLIRSRPLRLGVAFSLLGLSLWAFLPYATSRIASSAFVNAELFRVTAPLNGEVARDLPKKGEFLDHPTVVKVVEALSPDRRHLVDLEQQLSAAAATADLARKQLAEIAAADRQLVERSDAYRAATMARLQHGIAETEAERTGCLAEAQHRRDLTAQYTTLFEHGVLSRVQMTQAQTAEATAAARCQTLAARLDRLKTEQDAARNGTFVQEGANDEPYSAQQRDRLLLRQQELETDVLRQELAGRQLSAQLAEERGRVEELSHYAVTLPADHVVWSVAASPGAAVTEGQPILDVADCSHRFVAVELPERDFEAITAGESAAIRLLGSDEWVEGRVQQVRGSAARIDKRLLAAEVAEPGRSSITVEVALPQTAPPADNANFCNIGRLAEVRFRRSRLGWMDALLQPLTWIAAKAGRTTRLLAQLEP